MIALRAEHRRFALWAAMILVVALPLWWLWGADLALLALRPFADLALKASGLPGGAQTAPEGWFIGTGLPLADGRGALLFLLGQETLRRLLLGFPLLLAFLCAPPRSPRLFRAILIGLMVLSIVFVLSLTAYVWGELAPMLNPALAAPNKTPNVALAANPLHPALAQTALLGRYAGMSILPLLTAILVWLAVNPQAGRMLLPTNAPAGRERS
jgi:hypothetical protein